jgi:hypothetical protein
MMFNPWMVSCPSCKAKLEMGRASKIAAIFSMPLGLGWAGVAIYMEETKQWVTQDSLAYFAVTLPILMVIGYVIWPLTKFYAKQKNA